MNQKPTTQNYCEIKALCVFFVSFQLEDKKLKRLVMMLMLRLVTYFTHGILNNYLDTDKASVPVWGFIAIIVTIDIYFRRSSIEIKKGAVQ